MHLPTYITLTLSAIMYSIFNLWANWHQNRILFWAGVFTIIVSSIVSIEEASENFELRWVRAYIIPVGLLAFGLLAGKFELDNSLLVSAGELPLASSVPGSSVDYEEAAFKNLLAMVFPFFAKLISIGVEKIVRTGSSD